MMQFYYSKDHQIGFKQHFVMKCQCNYQLVAITSILLPIMLGSNPQFYEHFSVNFARTAKIDNSSVKSGEQSDFSHKIIKSNV